MPIDYSAPENVHFCPGRMSSWKTVIRSAEAVALREPEALKLCQASKEALERIITDPEAPAHTADFIEVQQQAINALEAGDWATAQALTKALLGRQLTFMAENVRAKLHNPAYPELDSAKQNSNFGHVCQVALNDTGEHNTALTPLLLPEFEEHFGDSAAHAIRFMQHWRTAHAGGCTHAQTRENPDYDPTLSTEERLFVLELLANVGRSAANLPSKDYSEEAEL